MSLLTILLQFLLPLLTLVLFLTFGLGRRGEDVVEWPPVTQTPPLTFLSSWPSPRPDLADDETEIEDTLG